MKKKDYEPIKFEIFQSDMEMYMCIFDSIIDQLEKIDSKESLHNTYNLRKIKNDLQHKIDCHIERGDWWLY